MTKSAWLLRQQQAALIQKRKEIQYMKERAS
jgi:hypothetical protein